MPPGPECKDPECDAAFVTGNTIVVKPSGETPINAFVFTDLAAFAGRVGTGPRIMLTIGRSLTRVNLERGGKAPAITLAGADRCWRDNFAGWPASAFLPGMLQWTEPLG